MFCNCIFVIGIIIYNIHAIPTALPDQESTTPDTSLPEITELDLAFIMDTTGSMGSYIYSAKQNIHQVVTEIVQSSPLDVRMALIEYRDHSDQFLLRQHDFTRSIRTMESWLRASNANGGGDGPEAVADALDGTLKLSWRPNAAKIGVLISDAPPHGLSSSFGCPSGHDPMKIIRRLGQDGITLYSLGCEPAISNYKDFFMALSYITGGQYIPLNNPRHLIDAIIGGTQEELSLQKFSKLVDQEIQKAFALAASGLNGTAINETEIAQSVYQKLSKEGATSTHLVLNNQTLTVATTRAKEIAECKSMEEVRKLFYSGHNQFSGVTPRPAYTYSPSGMAAFAPTPRPGYTYSPGVIAEVTPYPGYSYSPGGMALFSPTPRPKYTYSPGVMASFAPTPPPGYTYSAGIMSSFAPTHRPSGSGYGLPTAMSGFLFGPSSGSGGGSSGGSSSGTFSAIQSAISLDQINRLVNKGLLKVPGST